jgi:hypothetical protein
LQLSDALQCQSPLSENANSQIRLALPLLSQRQQSRLAPPRVQPEVIDVDMDDSPAPPSSTSSGVESSASGAASNKTNNAPDTATQESDAEDSNAEDSDAEGSADSDAPIIIPKNRGRTTPKPKRQLNKPTPIDYARKAPTARKRSRSNDAPKTPRAKRAKAGEEAEVGTASGTPSGSAKAAAAPRTPGAVPAAGPSGGAEATPSQKGARFVGSENAASIEAMTTIWSSMPDVVYSTE